MRKFALSRRHLLALTAAAGISGLVYAAAPVADDAFAAHMQGMYARMQALRQATDPAQRQAIIDAQIADMRSFMNAYRGGCLGGAGGTMGSGMGPGAGAGMGPGMMGYGPGASLAAPPETPNR